MTTDELLVLLAELTGAGYFAFLLLLVIATVRRRQLAKWATAETKWLRQEAEALRAAHKIIVQNREWESTKDFPGNGLVTLQYDERVREYEFRRKRLLQVTILLPKMFPW